MTLFEKSEHSERGEQPATRREPPSPAARRVSRIAAAVSTVLVVLLISSFMASQLPMPVRTWIAETIPGARDLVGLPPDPGQEIQALIDRMDLTAEGRALFEAARPRMVDDLGDACSLSEHEGPMMTLGCYRSIGRIYLLRDGGGYGTAVMTAIAAHELLHAAYDDLTPRDRDRLSPLLEREVARIDLDDPVHEQIASSVDGDDAALTNERFAYLGSQIVLPGGFSAELEGIYARWFVDRERLASSAD